MDVPYDKLLPALNRLLPERVLHALGDTTRFIRRLRQISASLFVWSVVLSRFGQSTPGFEQARQWFCRLAGAHVWQRPFQMRFKSPAAVALFERAFEQAVEPWRRFPRRVRHPLARRFPDVVLWDSTVVQVADALRCSFKGTRAAVASLKVVLGVSIWGLLPVAARVVAGHRHDMILGPPLKLFRQGTLLMFDKGFLAYDRLREIRDANLHYLCPMRLNGNAIVVGARRAPSHVRRALRQHPEGIWLRSLLHADKLISKAWDLDVVLWPKTQARSRQQVPSRLVIVPGPKRKQRPYLTSLVASEWPPRPLAELYRLRWQVELVFKELKQSLNLASVPSKDSHAVQVFVWASLIALALSRAVADWLMPLRQFRGLASALRLAVVSRAVRGNVHLLGYAMRSPLGQRRVFLAAFAERVLDEAQQRAPDRHDSFKRLAALMPARSPEACSLKPEALRAKAA